MTASPQRDTLRNKMTTAWSHHDHKRDVIMTSRQHRPHLGLVESDALEVLGPIRPVPLLGPYDRSRAGNNSHDILNHSNINTTAIGRAEKQMTWTVVGARRNGATGQSPKGTDINMSFRTWARNIPRPMR